MIIESVFGTMEKFFALLHSPSGICVHIWDQAKTGNIRFVRMLWHSRRSRLVYCPQSYGNRFWGTRSMGFKEKSCIWLFTSFVICRIIHTYLLSNVYFLFQSSRNCTADLISMTKKLEKHYLTSFFNEKKSNKLYNGRIENVLAHFLVAVLVLKRIWRKNYH